MVVDKRVRKRQHTGIYYKTIEQIKGSIIKLNINIAKIGKMYHCYGFYQSKNYTNLK